MPKWEDVKRALEDGRYKWRTLRGVAKETGGSLDSVREVIAQHDKELIKSSVPADTGEDLFTTRDHFRRHQSPLVKIASSLTSRVSSSSSSSSED